MKLRKFIATTIREYLNENVNRNKSRKVLFIDEYGKSIVYDDGDYRISVDNKDDCKIVTLFNKQIASYNNEEYFAQVGSLTSEKIKIDDKYWLSIINITIHPKHRNKGFGTKMYEILFDFSNENVAGICSYLPERYNKTKIPKIYKKYNAITKGNYQFIEFNN